MVHGAFPSNWWDMVETAWPQTTEPEVTLASTAEKQGFAAAVPEFMGAFASRALDPARRFLERLRAAPDDGASAAVERELQEWVDRVQLPHLGAAHTPAALRAAGVVPVGPGAAWVECARHAVLRTAWWSLEGSWGLGWVASKKSAHPRGFNPEVQLVLRATRCQIRWTSVGGRGWSWVCPWG